MPSPASGRPGWVQALLDSKPYWLPIVIGVGAMIYEIRRQKRQREARAHRAEAESSETPESAETPESPGAAGSPGDPGSRHAQR
jgi:hypothetical protein